MKRIFKKYFSLSVGFSAALFFYGCVTSLNPPIETDLTVAQKHWSNASLSQLNDGYTLYKNKCGSCHYLHRPNKYSEEKWMYELPEMGHRAKLDSLQLQLITRYILTARETQSFARK